MRFLSPFALVGLALIALPVAIHLLVRRHARRMDFPSLVFLRETPSFRLRFRRIQQPLLLTLRVAAIVFLVLGLAGPLVTFGTRKHRARVILLDASLSMQTRGRADATRDLARRLVTDLADGERVAIVAFSTSPLMLSSMTSDKRDLSEAIARYQPTNGAVNYAEGFKAAEALLQSETLDEISIDVVSDFQKSGLPREHLAQLDTGLVGRSKIITHPVGEQVERNSIIVDEDVTGGDSLYEISGSELLSTPDGRSGIRKTWPLDSRDGSRMGLVWHTEANGQITARITAVGPDDFDADDERFIAFTPTRQGRALLIERDGDDAAQYLRAALEATSTDLGEKRFKVDVKPVLPNSSSDLASYSLVVLTLDRSPRANDLQALTDYARAGGLVFFCLGNDVDTSQWNQFASTEAGRSLPFAELERQTNANQVSGFGSIDSDAPALRLMNEKVLTVLRTVRMSSGFVVTPRVGSTTLMRWNDATPAFVGMAVGGGNVLLLATSPARANGELGISAAFPALMSSIVRMGISPREPLSRDIGQPVDLGLAKNSTIRIVDANGKSVTARTIDLLVHPTNYFPSPGIYHVESESFTTYLAFNSPEAESEIPLALATAHDSVFKTNNTSAVPKSSAWNDLAKRSGNAWRYFLFTAFGLLVADLFITIRQSGRKWIKAD